MSETCECPTSAGASTCELRSGPVDSVCPACGRRGKRVDLVTLKALLAVPLTEILHADYLFCKTADCPIVYYSRGDEQTFREEHLRERVHQKHPTDDDVFVCYCFRHTAGSVRSERADPRRPGVVEAITAGIQAGKCACELRNPQGSCCLGNVRALLGP